MDTINNLFSFIKEITPNENNTILSSLYLFLVWIIFLISHRVLPKVARKIAKRTTNIWDDILVEKRFLYYASLIIPCIILLGGSDYLYKYHPLINATCKVVINLLVTLTIYLTIHAFFNSVLLISEKIPSLKDKPVKGYIQIIQIIGILIVAIFCLAIIFQKPLIYFFSGIGATAALFLLIFKDSILGFVTSVQLTANQMVKKGDWISMEKYKADGTVIDISLNTVKIQNWDKTISTIPTYAMMSDSFQNWKGMEETGGRRIKRSLFIDINSIRICTTDFLNELKEIDLISELITTKENEILEYNSKNIKGKHPINGRQLTNIGLFRYYIESYLKNNVAIRKDLTFLVRQLQPTQTGIPIEIYVFANETNWVRYENIQADIFDHFLTIAPYFRIKLFQNPSNNEYLAMLNYIKSNKMN